MHREPNRKQQRCGIYICTVYFLSFSKETFLFEEFALESRIKKQRCRATFVEQRSAKVTSTNTLALVVQIEMNEENKDSDGDIGVNVVVQ